MALLKKGLLLSLLFISSQACAAMAGNSNAIDSNTFAIINGEQVSAASYLSVLNSGVRQRFYHGNVPADEMAAFRKEVAARMVDGMLLLQEARRRSIEPDHEAVKKQLDSYERRYSASAQWRAQRDRMLPALREQLENQSRILRITETLKEVASPSESAIKQYYKNNPEKFTTPERRKVSMIMLKVAPSSAQTVWDEARTEATKLLQRIKSGESFAELAKLHSADQQSASAGGDMGYLHRGMLAEKAEEVLDKLKVGELSDPVTTLQGVVILRLDDIAEARLNPYETVKQRAGELLSRDLSEEKYQQALDELRSKSTVVINVKLVTQDK